MPSKLDIYKLGLGGVQLTKGEKHLADNEVVRSQNAELVLDTETGGEGTLSKRGGLITLTSELSGNILGMAEVRFLDLSVETLTTTTEIASADLDTLAATPITIAPASGGVLYPIYAKVRFVRSGGTAWSVAPTLRVRHTGLTVDLLAGIAIDGFTSNAGSTVDKYYDMIRDQTEVFANLTTVGNLALQVSFSADTTPGSTATMTVELVYQSIMGLY